MKKLVVFLLLALIVFPVYANRDYQSLSMGNLKAAFNPDTLSEFANPAILAYFDNSYKVYISTDATVNIPASFPYLKQTEASVVFAGNNMLIGMDLLYFPMLQADGLYTLRHSLGINTVLSYRLDDFAFGLGFSGSSEKERQNIKLENTFFSGLLSESLFGRYETVSDSESVELSAGFAYSNSGFTFGLVCENMLASSSVSDLSVTLDSIADNTDIGMYYTMDKYSRMGRLNSCVFSFGVEGQKLWDEEDSSVNLGLKLMYQFSRNLNVSLMTGAEFKTSMETEKSIFTSGLSFSYDFVRLTFVSYVPFGVFNGTGNDKTKLSLVTDLVF